MGRQELVVGGWMPGKGKRSASIGALLLGVYEADGQLRYVGRVGSGFSDDELERLSRAARRRCARGSSPFTAGEKPPREALFCEPQLVAEVEFSEWTAGGSLRQPVYKGLREDKPAEQVVREDAAADASAPRPRTAPGAHGDAAAEQAAATRPSDARSAVDPRARREGRGDDGRGPRAEAVEPRQGALSRRRGSPRATLIDYYAAIAPVLLRHLAGAPLTVTRWPDGVEGKSFFQKQAPAHRPEWVRTATLASERKPIDYMLADDLPTLVWLANLAAIELHVPLARAEAIERPTALVFDLDPGAPASDRRVLPRRAAAAGHVRAPRPAELRQDVRLEGAAGVRAAELRRGHLRAHEAVREGGRGAARAAPNRSWSSRA